MLDKVFSGNSRSAIVKKNMLGSVFIKGISVIIQLMLVPMTLGYVTSELYGIWLTLSSIVLWFNFFDIGFTLGLKNKLTEAIDKEDWSTGKSLVSTTYIIVILIFVPLCLILEVVTPYINWCSLLNVNVQYEKDIINTMEVLELCFCIQMIVNVFSSVASAFQKTALAAAFPVMGNAVSLVAIYLLSCFCSSSLIKLSFAISVAPILIMGMASAFYYSGQFHLVAPSFACFSKSKVKDLFSLGIKFFIIQVQMVIFYQSTNFLISHLSGANAVSCYNVAYRYLSIGMLAYSTVITPLWPAFTDAFVKSDFSWMNAVYRRMLQLLLLLSVITIVMTLVSPFIYHLWIGNSILIPSILTIVICIYMIEYMWLLLHSNILNGIGFIKLQTYITLFGLILHIPLSLILGHWIGYYGVISSMIVITTLYNVVFTLQVRNLLKGKAYGIWCA